MAGEARERLRRGDPAFAEVVPLGRGDLRLTYRIPPPLAGLKPGSLVVVPLSGRRERRSSSGGTKLAGLVYLDTMRSILPGHPESCPVKSCWCFDLTTFVFA